MTKTLAALLLVLMPLCVHAQSVHDKIQAALKMDYRTQAELARDASSSPI